MYRMYQTLNIFGDTAQQNVTKEGFIGASGDAYKRVYPSIAAAIESGADVEVKYVDFDNGIVFK